MIPFFFFFFFVADCLCCHPKIPHFLVKYGLFNCSHPKTPYFFAFGCHRKLLFVSISSTNFCHFHSMAIIFAIFDDFFFFFCKFLLLTCLKRSLKDQSKFSPNAPNLASHPMTSHFLRLCSHRMPQPLEVWAYTRIYLILECPPPPNRL